MRDRPMSEATRRILRDSGPSTIGVHYAAQLRAAPSEVTVGPFRFMYRPDGDDPGVGSVLMQTRDAEVGTPFTVTLHDWHLFVEAAT